MKKLTHEEWYLKYKDNISNTLQLIGKYNGVRNKIKVKCKLCEKVYDTFPYVLVGGSMCKHCSIAKTHEQFIHEMHNKNQNVEIIGRYYKDNEKVLVKCAICETEWYAIPTHLLRGHGCPKCGEKQRILKRRSSQCDFEQKLKKCNSSIICIGKYVNSSTKINVKSTICGHEWYAMPNNLLYNNSGCPICRMSHGEKKIYLYLKSKNITFSPQKVFNNLIGINNRNLSYDFYLPNYNLLIEYQGEFHDGTANQQTEEEYKIQQEHDKRKREYAKEHGIKLLEIWHWDYENIEQILSRELSLAA